MVVVLMVSLKNAPQTPYELCQHVQFSSAVCAPGFDGDPSLPSKMALGFSWFRGEKPLAASPLTKRKGSLLPRYASLVGSYTRFI